MELCFPTRIILLQEIVFCLHEYLHIYKQSNFREQSTIVLEFRNSSTTHKCNRRYTKREQGTTIGEIKTNARITTTYKTQSELKISNILDLFIQEKHRNRALVSNEASAKVESMHIYIAVWYGFGFFQQSQDNSCRSVVFIVFCLERKGKAESKAPTVISRIQPNQYDAHT